MTTFAEVVQAWQKADVDAIHPLRADHESEYWESGWHQAKQVAAFAPPGGLVVDFGCGEGRVSIPLAHMGFGVIAVDASEVMLRRLLDNAKKEGNDFNPDDLTVLPSDGSDLSKVGRLVDVVVARAVFIHHSPADQTKLVLQLANVLKPGGHLMVDWPVGNRHERRDWIDVTVVTDAYREASASTAGLELVESHPDGYSVWKRVS